MVTVLEAIMAAEAQALADNAPKWISVKGRLPENSNRVLLRDHSKDCTEMAYYHKGQWRDINTGNQFSSWFTPTHWMPLPAPPQEDEK